MKTLTEIYKEIDAMSLDSKYLSDVADLLTTYRDTLSNEKLIEEAQKLQWEIDCYHFTFRSNKIFPRATWTNQEGNVVQYPEMESFSPEAFTYFIERLGLSKSDVIKAKISHLLWFSPQKNISYAQQAVQSYLISIEHYEKKDLLNPNDHYGLILEENLKNAFYLAVSVKYKVDEIKNLILRLVKSFNIASSSVYATTARLVDLMLENKKIFLKDDFDSVLPRLEELSKKIEDSNPHLSIDLLRIIVKVADKVKIESKKWKIRIAELYVKLAKTRENLVAMSFCKDAVKIYKELGESAEVKKLEEMYDELKKGIHLGQFEQKIDMAEVLEQFRKDADEITDKDAPGIVQELMFNTNIIPDLAYVEKQVHDSMADATLMHIIPATILDGNGHTVEYFSEDDEKHYYELLWSFHLSITVFRCLFIREIMIQSIKKKKLDTAILLQLFRERSWYGKNLTKTLPGTVEYTYNWLNLIAPSLLEYFSNLDVYLSNPSIYPNFQLCIDSLSLKFEGLFRDICSRMGIITFFFTEDKKGRKIAKEKDINALLHETDLTNLISKDDLFFFKFLLIEKAGLNLRNNVAHSLMNVENYTFDYANLLIIGLLKLGKYDFQDEPSGNE